MVQESQLPKTEVPTLGSFLAGIYLFSVPILSYSGELGLSMIPQYIGLLLVLYAVYDFLKIKLFTKSRFIRFYSLFTIWCIIGYFYSEHQSQTGLLLTLIKVTVITISITQLIKNRSDFILSLLVFFTSIFVALYLNYSELISLKGSDDLTNEERFAGSFANANTAAMYCLAVFWVAFVLLFWGKLNRLLNLLIITGVILAAGVILYTGSRKGLLGLGFFSIGITWVSIKRFGTTYFRRILIGMILLVALIFLFRFIYTSPYFYRLQGMFEGEASANERLYLFKQAITIWTSSIKNLLWGIGINNFMYYNELYAYSHSTIAETLVSTGLIGFAIYFAGLFSAFSEYFRLYRTNRYADKSQILFFIFMLIVILLLNATAVMYDDRIYLPLLGAISSYGLYLKNEMQENPDEETTVK